MECEVFILDASHLPDICVLVLVFSRLAVFDSVTLWTVNHQAPLSMGFAKARILEWVAMSSSRESSWSRIELVSSGLAGVLFTNEPPGKPYQTHDLQISSLILDSFCTFFMVSFKKHLKNFLKSLFFFFFSCCHLWLVLYLRRVLSNAKAKIHLSFLLRLIVLALHCMSLIHFELILYVG